MSTRRTRKPPVPVFDHSTYGQIFIEPLYLFPDTALDPACPIPRAMLADPWGAGKAVMDFLSGFSMTEGRAVGKSLTDAMSPLQRADVLAVHGYRDPQTWTRYINWSPYIAARKNFKTFRLAVHGLAFLFSSHEANGLILVAATSQRQARRTYDLMLMLLRTNPRALAQIRVQDHLSQLTHVGNGTVFKAVASVDPGKLYGSAPHVLLLDELHAWAGSKGHRLLQAIITGMGARRSPVVLAASTGPDEPGAATDVFYEMLRKGRDIVAGRLQDPRALPLLYVTPADADHTDERVWRAANPGLGYSLDMAELRESFETAKSSEAAMAGFKTMRLNQLPTTSPDLGWLQAHVIERMVQPFPDEEMMDCPIRVLGLDLGGGWDMESIALVCIDDDGRLLIRQWSFISQDGYD